MPSLMSLKAQGRALVEDQDALVKDARPWSAKKAEFDHREADIKAVISQVSALESVGGGGSPFDRFDLGAEHHDMRQLKGLHAGIASQGHRPILAPQIDLSTEDTKGLYEAAVSHKSFAVTSKVADSTSVAPATISDYRVPPVPMRREPNRVLSLIPTFATASPSVTWYSTTGTTAAAATAEGGIKPTSTVAYTAQVGTVTKLAHILEVTDETVADFPSFLGVVQLDMVDGIVKAENDELLTATVTGASKFAGLLNTSGILTAAVPATPTQNDRLDAISAAFDALRVGSSFAEPTGIVMHPSDWGTVRRNKDTQGRYLLGDPGTGTDPRIWGVAVVLTTQITRGTALIGDFAGSTAAYVREGIRMETASQGSAQFSSNTTLVRAEERILLTVPRPSGLLKLTGL